MCVHVRMYIVQSTCTYNEQGNIIIKHAHIPTYICTYTSAWVFKPKQTTNKRDH